MHLHVRSNGQSVQLATSHENLVKNRLALVTHDIAKVLPSKPSITRMANWPSQQMFIPKRMEVENCFVALTSWINPHEIALQKQVIRPEDSVNATRIYKAPETMEEIFKRHHQVKQKDAEKARKAWE